MRATTLVSVIVGIVATSHGLPLSAGNGTTDPVLTTPSLPVTVIGAVALGTAKN